ncbi:hypothetical protein NDU88_002137 [Pleurodeles waltl]|uniref:Uncharacterized protein n=1 Tax=Pleurodeles waltl TaxID=8319 RepID=A0AAV7VCA3_PLEWA|nr:hypothetical protein NDU88_002137 [Pleurodeles waltl]
MSSGEVIQSGFNNLAKNISTIEGTHNSNLAVSIWRRTQAILRELSTDKKKCLATIQLRAHRASSPQGIQRATVAAREIRAQADTVHLHARQRAQIR